MSDLPFSCPWKSRLSLEDFWRREETCCPEDLQLFAGETRDRVHPPWAEHTFLKSFPAHFSLSGFDANHCFFQSFSSPFHSCWLSLLPTATFRMWLTSTFCKAIGCSFSCCSFHQTSINTHSIAQLSVLQGSNWTSMGEILALSKTDGLESPCH